MLKTSYLCLALFACAAIALSQQTLRTRNKQDDRVIVGTNLVTVSVIVTDRNGNYVRDLSQDQFTIYDNKVKQQIAHFSADKSPVSIGIVCEIHETAPEQVRAVLTALKQFTRSLSKEDDFFFMAFGEHGSLTVDFIPSSDQVLDHLRFVKPGGPSSLYDAVYLAAGRLKHSRNLNKTLLLISDGYDTSSRQSYKKVRDRLRTLDAQIYAIGINDPALDPFAGLRRWFFEDITRQGIRRSVQVTPEVSSGRAVLEEMSRASGGTTYLPPKQTESEIAYICSQIALELRQQYTLAFYSAAMSRNEWHTLKVRILDARERTDLRLSYRKGYQISHEQ